MHSWGLIDVTCVKEITEHINMRIFKPVLLLSIFPLIIKTNCNFILSENVIFSKINEVSNSMSNWKVTLILDLRPYRHLLEVSLLNITMIAKANMYIIRQKVLTNEPAFKQHFDELKDELRHLNDTRKKNMILFEDYTSLQYRQKRSIIPILGKGISWLIGSVTEDELNTVKIAMNKLNLNQAKIQHIVKDSLSFLNLSHTQIVQNRKRINKLNSGIDELVRTVLNNSNAIRSELNDFKMVFNYYLQLQSMVSNTRELMYETLGFLENFVVMIDTLSEGHISPNILTPTKLHDILVEIKSKLPPQLRLPIEPSKRLWDFYILPKCYMLHVMSS